MTAPSPRPAAPGTGEHARVALAWHDVTCPEAADCRDRLLHAASAPVANGGILDAFLARLAALAPAALDTGRCGDASPSFIGAPPDICVLAAGHAGWHRGDPQPHGRAAEWSDARPMAAPDTTGVVREAIARKLAGTPAGSWWAYLPDADELLALPALRDLLAERDTLAAKVRAVEGVMRRCNACRGMTIDRPGEARAYDDAAEWIRRALGTPTTGGGE